MPYEIILQGKEVGMLHGKYRFALYWTELTMGTFMKINEHIRKCRRFYGCLNQVTSLIIDRAEVKTAGSFC